MSEGVRALGPGDDEAVLALAPMFDNEPDPSAVSRFLAESNHHMLVAYDAESRPRGFVSGIETTHPDKGTEMFLYELAVEESARHQGVGKSLVTALATLARRRGCYGMWVATEPENVPALATYRAAAAQPASTFIMLEWDFGVGF